MSDQRQSKTHLAVWSLLDAETDPRPLNMNRFKNREAGV